LEAPTRHALDWRGPDFYDEAKLLKELERVFEICHGCRRCVNLCTAFPTLFGLVDESKTLEGDSGQVAGADNAVFVQHHEPLDQIFNFPHIARPIVTLQQSHRRGIDFQDRLAFSSAVKL